MVPSIALIEAWFVAQGKYASAAADALALLESMLLFNPDKRASLPDTLSSEYLKDSAQTCASPPHPPVRASAPAPGF